MLTYNTAPIRVQGPDGQLYEFAGDTDSETMRAAMAKRYGGPTHGQVMRPSGPWEKYQARANPLPPLPPGFVLEEDTPPLPPGFVLEDEPSGPAGPQRMIEVDLPDGSIAEFPAGMSDADIERVLQEQYTAQGGPWEKYQQAAVGAATKGQPGGPWQRYAGTTLDSTGYPWDQDEIVAPAPTAGMGNPWDADPIVARSAPDFSNVKSGATTIPGQEAPSWLDRQAQGAGMGVRSMIQGAGSLVGMLGGDAVNYLVADPIERAVTGRDVQSVPMRERAAALADRMGLPEPQTRGQRVLSDVGEALTGTAATLGAGAALNAARPLVPTVANRVGQLLGAQPGLQAASAATGASAASMSREGGGNRWQQLAAGLIGGMAPGAAGLVTPFVRSQGTVPAAAQALTRVAVRGRDAGHVRDAIGDFAASGATPSVGQATGSRPAQALETLVGNVPGGAGRMERFGRQQTQAVAQRMDDIAAGLSPRGGSATPQQTGRTIVQGIEGPGGYMARFRTLSNRLYGELDQQIPQGTKVPASNAAAYLSRQASPIAGANATSAMLANPKLASIRQALEADINAGNGQLPYQALASVRSRVGEMISEAGLLPDIPTRQLRGLYGALSQDMRAAAQAAGPAAEKAFTRANNHFKYGTARLERIEHVIDKSGGPEKVYAAAFGGINQGATTLRSVMQSLDKAAQRELTASFIRRMGRASSSQQNAAGDAFSMETFLTNWDKVSPEARRALFDRHGATFSHNMDRIARMAERVREGSRVFRNTSGTTRQAALMQTGGTGLLSAQQAIMGNVGAAVLTIAASAGSAIAANRMARLLTNPKAVAWLASNTTKPVGELLGQLQMLRQVAERDGDQELAELASQLGEVASQAPAAR
ncbi:hypothetical protein [Luteimonas sp. SDU82]|uniref:hypothetical protein n=1 Tax=Luteimonas sp. SDU82 TaxID=3422592 RepID=UPI003EB9CE35